MIYDVFNDISLGTARMRVISVFRVWSTKVAVLNTVGVTCCWQLTNASWLDTDFMKSKRDVFNPPIAKNRDPLSVERNARTKRINE